MFTLTIHTENAAFEDARVEEVSRILADLLRRIGGITEDDRLPLFDTNGNRVGECGFTD